MNDERFFAWLDGELDAASEAEVAALVAADPDLQRKAGAHRAMQDRLRSAFEPVMTDSNAAIPAVAADTDKVVDLAAARSRRVERRALPSMTQWAAIAATLVVGIVAGSMIGANPQSPVGSDAGYIVASTQLEQALDLRLASAPAATGPRIGLTFRDQAGSICRSFTDGAAQGLACRDGASWRIRGLVQGADSASGEYRMAAGADPVIAALIDSAIQGEPFDAAAERRAQAQGWR